MSLNSEVALSARRHISLRLLPFVFLLYVVAYLDRANVSFAALRMNFDLGFSDRVYGLGVAMFYLGYVLFEIPGAIIVERWSARKWMARIMISWGLATIFSGLVHTAAQFYAARFCLGLAEASFFPGMIVYLTHWFRLSDRGRAVAALYTAVPVSAVIGSPLAGWLLGIAWKGLPGWRWIFFLEGIPAIVLGFAALFYMTDWPREAQWLAPEERVWISDELEAEKRAKKEMRSFTIWQALRDPQNLSIAVPYMVASTGLACIVFWLPTLAKRLSGLPDSKVTLWVMLPPLAGLAGLLFSGWHSDKTGERKWHALAPMACTGLGYLLAIPANTNFPLVMALFTIAGFFMYAHFPPLWAMPTMVLSESAAAAAFGLINGIGHVGGFFGPYIIGDLNTRTHSLLPGLAFIAGCYLVAALLVLRVKVRNPIVERSIVALPYAAAKN